MYLTLDFAARSDVGLIRRDNQDSGFAGSHLLVVADGMGGAAGGDIASSIAVARLVALEGESHGPDESLDELKKALADAHAQIVERAENDPELSGLATTVTALLRAGSTLAMAHVGDSRAYLLRDGEFTQVTTDHSFVQHLVDTGRLSPADAENHPQRNLILRVLGDVDTDIPIDISVRETRVDDRWLLCSDGLTSVVHKDTIRDTLTEVEDVADCADALINLALAAGAPDNVTVIVADVVDIDAGRSPSTASQIVGSAALDRHRPTAGGGGAAGKAARLTAPSDDGEKPEPTDPSRRGLWRNWLLPVVALVVAGIGLSVAYLWSQTQYFVGTSEGNVAVFQGIPQNTPIIPLHTVVEVTDIEVESLTVYEQGRLEDTIRTSSLEEALSIVETIAGEA